MNDDRTIFYSLLLRFTLEKLTLGGRYFKHEYIFKYEHDEVIIEFNNKKITSIYNHSFTYRKQTHTLTLSSWLSYQIGSA